MKQLLHLLPALFVFLSIGADAQSIIRGPYLQLGTPSSMVIKWRTDLPTSSRVWYGSSPASLAFTQTVNGSFTDHEVTIGGLPANTTFYYAVGNTAGQLTTPDNDHYFKTSPTPGSNGPVSIWVLGDAGQDTDEQRSVRDAFYTFNGGPHADVILALGDNAYSDGTDDEYQYAWFENMFEASLINSAVWSCVGNHDLRSASSITETGVYYDIFTFPRNGEAGGVPSGTEAYYSFDYGNIHFVCLNAEDISHSPDSPMLAWLQQDLTANTQPWVVAFLHRGIHHSSAMSDFRHNFVPILEAGGVDLVLGGHSHSYRRSYLIDGHYGDSNGDFDPNTMTLDAGDGRPNGSGAYQKPSGATPNAGTIYMVAGSAGSVNPASSSIDFMPYVAGAPEGLGSVHIAVSDGVMDVTFVNYQTQILDYFTINKQVVIGAAPTVSVTAPVNGANFTAPQPITITADASDSDGSVTQVEFFINNNSIGVDGQAPYSIDYAIPGDGAYSIVASASDNDGNTTSSPVVQFTVGSPVACSRVSTDSDDGEEQPSGAIDLTSSDLELTTDGGEVQTIGMRFTGLNIPQGATISNAYLQFTVDEDANDDPCALTIYGEDSDDAATFDEQDYNISNRPRAAAFVSWAPPNWLAVGDAGSAQQTPDITPIIQEIVNRPGFTANSAIAIFIEGTGRRTAESFDGDSSGAPELCVEYSTAPVTFDCPNLSANIGDACDDGDNTTTNDLLDANCNCTGDPCPTAGTACDDGDPTTYGDLQDGSCNCTGTPCAAAGTACDDNDLTTTNDQEDGFCNCAGTPIPCASTGDADGDGICGDVDCDDNDASITYQPGDVCDDGNSATYGETIQADCSCAGGTLNPESVCAYIISSSDDAEEQTADGQVDDNSSDLELCTDGGLQWVGLRFEGLNIPYGANIVGAYLQFQVDESNNDDPCTLTIYGQAADNAATFTTTDLDISSRPRTTHSVTWAPAHWASVGDTGPDQQTPGLEAIIQEIVNRNGYTSSSSIAFLIEGTGRRVAESFDGNGAGPQLCIDFFATPPDYDCPSLSAFIGDACDDGDNTTVDDAVGADCTCAGAPTACTNIGDADGDGVCADVDCDDNNASITSTSTNDADCDGVPTADDCNDNDASIGSNANDMDCDGVLAGADCNDNDPNVTSYTGQPCSDGDNTTINDMLDANCTCTGTPTACTGPGDMDGDGICSNVDCDDSDPSITTQPGDACDDGNPVTHGETIQADCTCGGGSLAPETACSSISISSDDAEENIMLGRVDLNSSDLELCTDGSGQWVGLRFNNLNIPQGANIISTHIQFQVDETRNDDPCGLTIYGVASDDAATFSQADYDISSRPRTTSSVAWSPEQWLSNGAAGPAQQTPDLAVLLQEIVNRSGYSSASSIAFVIEGTGRRVAESFDGNAGGPQLCIEFFATPPDYDCNSLSAFIGDPCDDGDNTTLDDMVDSDCNCTGTPTACTGIGDIDGDGICSNVDCDDSNPNITTQPGDACDDGNPATINDAIDANCGCTGALNTCPNAGDNDGDGICADVDCDDNDANVTTRPGDACDDGNPNTVGETIQADCTCGGGNSAPTQTCSMISANEEDAEEELMGNSVDQNSSDLELAVDPRFGAQMIGLKFNELNIPQGAAITSAKVQFTVDEAVNDDPCTINIYGEATDNPVAFENATGDISSRPRTTATVSWAPPAWQAVGDAGAAQQTPDLSAIIQEIVDRTGFMANSSIVLLMDGTGRRTAESINGSINGAPELCVEYLYAPMANAPMQTGTTTTAISRSEGQPTAIPTSTIFPYEAHAISPISVYPNPATDELRVSFNSDIEGTVRVEARNLNGMAVLNTAGEVERGENTILLKSLSLPSGAYFLQIHIGSSIRSEKFIIMKK